MLGFGLLSFEVLNFEAVWSLWTVGGSTSHNENIKTGIVQSLDTGISEVARTPKKTVNLDRIPHSGCNSNSRTVTKHQSHSTVTMHNILCFRRFPPVQTTVHRRWAAENIWQTRSEPPPPPPHNAQPVRGQPFPIQMRSFLRSLVSKLALHVKKHWHFAAPC